MSCVMIRAPIPSFVRRQGRMTRAQKRALETLSAYRIEASQHGILDLETLFGRKAPKVLEIGFGNGDSLAQMAEESPETDFLGIDVYPPGIGHLLLLLERRDLSNVRVIDADAQIMLERQIKDASLARIQVFFPDPWPKKRHHKRRMVDRRWVALALSKVEPGGVLHLATDWEDYAQQMLDAVSACDEFINTSGPGRFAERPSNRPITAFEKRGLRLGHCVYDLIFQRRLA